MLQPKRRSRPAGNKPVMVMLHGSGSSAAIFGVQTHFLAKELSKTFELVFLDAPTPSSPGPGVLPLFAGMPGYFRWLTALDHLHVSATVRLAEVFSVARYIQAQLDTRKIAPARVAAMFGFSQGALVAMAMLGLWHVEQTPWENLRFCVSVGAGAGGNEVQLAGIENLAAGLADVVGVDDGKFPGYVVHAVGIKDLWYRDGKRLAGMCHPNKSTTMDYRDGHVVPRQKDDVSRLLKAIAAMDEKSKSEPPSVGNLPPVILDLLPSLLDPEGHTKAPAVLGESGMNV
jgi:pimeloyl-ACP methyl ester carboxylesterase